MFRRRPTRAQRSRRAKSAARRPKSRRFSLETLEDRRMMAIFTVSNTGNAGLGSLRQAIIDANAAANVAGVPDEIRFAIAGAGLKTIQPTTQLDAITDAVVIDGYTQVGTSSNTNGDGFGLNTTLLIEIDGSGAGIDANGLRLVVGSSGSMIRGLVINRFDDNGILIDDSNNNRILGNFIGTDATGNIDLGNVLDGVLITGDSFNNKVGDIAVAGRNLISGNNSDGIEVRGTDADVTLITGNFLGTNRAGTTALGNSVNGVFVTLGATQTIIGGLVPNTRNIISGNLDDGIQVAFPSALGTSITGNFIGVNVTGTAAVPNVDDGVVFSNGANNNILGGTTLAARNIISGNGINGVAFQDAGTSNNRVQGNFIGLAFDGASALGNGVNGVLFDNEDGNGSPTNNTIGGTDAGARNIISGNGFDGVRIVDVGTSGNMVFGNFIGTNANGNEDLGNGDDGVEIGNGATNNRIGDNVAAARNIISGNNDEGVEISGEGTSGNFVQGNFIGTAADGSSDLGNTNDGVDINSGATNNLVGGPDPGDGNTIAFNDDGVVVEDDSTGNRIQRNSIFNNVGLGIDLGDDGSTGANTDPGDPDAGPNLFQNIPQFIGDATLLGNSFSVRYRVNSAPANSGYPLDIEFFIADFDNQEGRTYLATDQYALANAQQEKQAIIPLPASLTNAFFVATATDANGNTSEFSAPFEIAFPTILGSEPTVILPNQTIGQDDVDFYQYIAHSTGKLVVRIDFLHALGDLALEVRDENGNLIAGSNTSSIDQNFEELVIPVVGQERYFISVIAVDFDAEQTQTYSLEVENFPAPFPSFVDLVSGSDTGMMNNDNITRDTTPTFRIQSDLTNFIRNTGIATLDQSTIDPNNDGNASDSTASGAGVFVTLVHQTSGVEVSGFANRVGTNNSLWEFTPSTPLPDGEYFVSAAVQIVDGANPRATDRTQLSEPLIVVIDTLSPVYGTFDLLDSSDSGMFSTDNVTKINRPAFGGVGQAGSKVFVYAQATNATGQPIGAPLLVGSGVVGSDNAQEPFDEEPFGISGLGPLGTWEVTVEPIRDGKWNFSAVFEDVAGNVSGPVSSNAFKQNDTATGIPNGGTILPAITFNAGDFPAVGNLPNTNVPVLAVTVIVNIAHTSDEDLDLTLIAPDGTPIELSTDNGGSGNDFTNTIFDDAASQLIVNGVAPFSSSFRPEAALSQLLGKNAIGEWHLQIADDSLNDFTGRFLNWTILVQTPLMVVIDTEGPNTPYLDLLDDTGRHDNDNITKTNKPSFSMTTTDPNVAFSQLLFTDNFKFRIYDRFENGAQEVLVYDSAQDILADANLTAGDMFTALTQLTRQLPVLTPASPGITALGNLADGVHNLKLEVEDRAGNISHDYVFELVVDTMTPPVSFGLQEAEDATDGLTASSDSGVTTTPSTFADRVTSDTTPTFWGHAEADTVVRLYFDLNANGVIDLGVDTFLGQTTALPLDGNDAFPDGYWEITSIRDLNQIVGVPKDGLRRLLVTAQDVAGNPMAMVGEGTTTISEGVAQLKIFIDTQGPQITSLTVNNLTSDQYDLFDLKPTQTGPTPAVNSLRIAFRDLPSRVIDGLVNDFRYPALAADIAAALGNYKLVGDFNGVIPIDSISVTTFAPAQISDDLTAVASAINITAAGLVNASIQPEVGDYITITSGPNAGQVRRIVGYDSSTGQMQLDAFLLNLPNIGNSFTIMKYATAYVELKFAEPLPDDRYTLTVSDNLVDPANNKLDGESNAVEPIEFPNFPTGDGVPGGKFVARFTIDSRPEIGVWAAGAVKIDTNGNFYFDPAAVDAHNRDLAYTLGFSSDYVFAGNFGAVGKGADGFDKLAVYGRVGSQWRWLIDFSNDGIPDAAFNEAAINGIPVAGNFDGNEANGDEVGIFTGSSWHFDRNHSFSVDTTFSTAYQGFPVVGDFDGDGDDDVATYVASKSGGNKFYIDINTAGAGNAISIDGFADYSFVVGLSGLASAGGYYGFPGVRERPVAADMNADGVDDLGLWVPDGTTLVPGDEGEWYFLLSGNNLSTPAVVENSIVNRAAASGGFIPFNITPFGRDLYARFGNSFALPIVGNFDPPVTPAQAKAVAAAKAAAKAQTAKPTSTTQAPVAAAVATAPAPKSTAAKNAPTASTAAPNVSSTAKTVTKTAAVVTTSTVVAPAISTTTTTTTKKSSKSTSQSSSGAVVTSTTPPIPVVAATAAPVVVSGTNLPASSPTVAQKTTTQSAVYRASAPPAVVTTTTTTKSKSSKGTTNKAVTTTASTQTPAAVSSTPAKPAVKTTNPVTNVAAVTTPPVVIVPPPATVVVSAPKVISQIIAQQTTTTAATSSVISTPTVTTTIVQAAPKVVAAKSPVIDNSVIAAQQPAVATKPQATLSFGNSANSTVVAATKAEPLTVAKSAVIRIVATSKVADSEAEGSIQSVASKGVFQFNPMSDGALQSISDKALQDPATADAAMTDLHLLLVDVEESLATAKATSEQACNFDGWQDADPVDDGVAFELASDILALAVR